MSELTFRFSSYITVIDVFIALIRLTVFSAGGITTGTNRVTGCIVIIGQFPVAGFGFIVITCAILAIVIFPASPVPITVWHKEIF
jgi:hypothetical protein